MKTKFKKLIVVTMLFCGCCSAVLSQAIVEFETITEALNWADTTDIENSKAVKKLVITGNISGEDYSESSEWSKFRTLDETFPNIEAVEILTDQDIPDADIINHCALFYWEEYDDDGIYIGNSGSNWLKSFSAPNVKKIGSWAFRDCKELLSVSFLSAEIIERWAFGYCWKLISIDFPLVTTIKGQSFYACKGLISISFSSAIEIDDFAFAFCNSLYSADFSELITLAGHSFYCSESLTYINFPKVKAIGTQAFYRCYALLSADFPEVTIIGGMAFSLCNSLISANFPIVTMIENHAFDFDYSENLISVSLGTGLKKETEITCYYNTFSFDGELTKNVDLTLGKYVLPKPDLNAKIWQGNNLDNNYYIDYVWRSITIETDWILDEEKLLDIFCIDKNIYYVNNGISEFELYDVIGRLVKSYSNESIVDLNGLNNGLYVIKYIKNYRIKIEKIIKN